MRKEKFTVIFINALDCPIDLYMVDFEGIKHHYSQEMESGTRTKKSSYFSYPWVFKRSSNGTRLDAFALGVNGSVFEGTEFGASINSTTYVTINDQGSFRFLRFKCFEMWHY